jgi:predicted membrane channel-forming protein YqfA (hemolysin III family)
MDISRLNNGERISGISAILLFVFMCFHWFGSKDSGELRLFSVDRNAWEALDYISIILLITIVVTLAAVMLRPPNPARKPPIPISAVVATLGAVSVLLILFRIMNPPNFGSFREIWGTIAIEGTVQFPIFLSLFAAVGIAFGGCLAMREEGRLGRGSG